MQYVGKRALPLHKRINIHRIANMHLRDDYIGSSFSIQILDCYVNGAVCPIGWEKRLGWEDEWIKTLKT